MRFSGAPNHNPELLDVTLADGGPLQGAVLPLNQEIRLYPHIPDGGPGGIETYVGLDGGVQHERFSYSWESTAGEVVDFRSAEPMPEDPSATSDIRFRTHELATPVRSSTWCSATCAVAHPGGSSTRPSGPERGREGSTPRRQRTRRP